MLMVSKTTTFKKKGKGKKKGNFKKNNKQVAAQEKTPSSMDDSSTILIEIRVDVDEGPHPNMTIGGRAQSSVKPR